MRRLTKRDVIREAKSRGYTPEMVAEKANNRAALLEIRKNNREIKQANRIARKQMRATRNYEV